MKAYISRWWRLIVFAVGVCALLFIIYWWIFVPWYIFQTGSPATARVLDVWETSTTINDEPLLGLRFEVRAEGEQPFQVEKRCRYSISDDWLFTTGVQVPAKVSPFFPERIVLVGVACDEQNASFLVMTFLIMASITLSFVVTPPLMRYFIYRSDLFERGASAPATLIKVWETGTTINDEPQIGLELEVRPIGESPYKVKTKQVLAHAQWQTLSPGMKLEVRYDPRRPKRVVVVPPPLGKETSPDIVDRLERLEELRQRHLISEQEFQEMRSKVLDEVVG